MHNFELVRQAKKGNKDTLVQLIMGKKDEYYKLALVYMGNQEDALDAMEDMIVILYENINKLKNDESFYSWSKTILVNCCKKGLRKRNKVLLLNHVPEETYLEKYEQKEQANDIHKYLEELNKEQQEAIKLRYFLDLDYQTIAEIMKVPVGTVKSRISTGIQRLRLSLGGKYHG